MEKDHCQSYSYLEKKIWTLNEKDDGDVDYYVCNFTSTFIRSLIFAVKY